MDDWPPDGFSDPKEYSTNDSAILLIAVAVSAVLGPITLPIIERGGSIFVRRWQELLAAVGITRFSTVLLSGVVVLGVGIVFLLVGMIAVHEYLHYRVGAYLGLNPVFHWDDSTLITNPSVVALSTRIPVREDVYMLVTPFLVITVFSSATLYLTGGLVSSVAAFVLLVNAASSSQDLYSVGRLLRMPTGTEFANFEQDDGTQAEYVILSEEDR